MDKPKRFDVDRYLLKLPNGQKIVDRIKATREAAKKAVAARQARVQPEKDG